MANKKVKDVVEAAVTETKAAAGKIAKTAEPAVKAAKEAFKDASEKAEPVIAKAKTAAKSAAKKAEPVLEAAKNAGKQVAAVFVPYVYVQYENNQYDTAELVERCKDDFRSKYSTGMIRSCRLYIKPEDHTVYYVINDIEDRIDL